MMQSWSKPFLWLAVPLLLLQTGCSSLMGTNRDTASGAEGAASANPFDLDKLPDQVESSWKTLIGKGVNPQKARELYVAAEGKYQEALRADSDQRQDAFAQAAKQFSDAAGRSKPEAYQRGSKALMRIITGVMMDQIRSLRARAILERMRNHNDRGAFLQIGNSCAEILMAAGKQDEIAEKCAGCLTPLEATQAAEVETDIARLTSKKFELLFRHGFENADYSLYGFSSDFFNYIGYS